MNFQKNQILNIGSKKSWIIKIIKIIKNETHEELEDEPKAKFSAAHRGRELS